jgi:hypothetical protein
MLFAAILVVNATSAFGKGKVDQAIEDHQDSRRKLKQAHQELFEKMDRYHEAVSSKNPDPAKIATAKQEISATNQRINGILQDAHARINTLIQSMEYSIEDGLREKTGEDDEDSGTPLAESEVASFLAKNPPPEATSEASPPAEGMKMGFPSRGRVSPRSSPSPSPTAPAVEVAAPEIVDPQGSREFTFGKRSAKPGTPAPLPTPHATPNARAN